MMRDARDPLTVELPFKLSAYPLELFDTVAVTLSRYGWVAKTFMVLSRSFSSDGSLVLSMKETGAAIVTMDAGFAAQGFAANTNLPKPWQIASVGALTVTSGTSELLKQADGTVVSRIRVAWAQVPDQAVVQNGQVEVQYRRVDSSGAWSSLVVAGNETAAVTSDVLDGMVPYTIWFAIGPEVPRGRPRHHMINVAMGFLKAAAIPLAANHPQTPFPRVTETESSPSTGTENGTRTGTRIRIRRRKIKSSCEKKKMPLCDYLTRNFLQLPSSALFKIPQINSRH